MAFKLTNAVKENLPALRFIGRKYLMKDQIGGSFGALWGEWFQSGRFAELEKLGECGSIENGYIGLERYKKEAMESGDMMSGFEYWIGMFFDAGKEVPAGFDFVDLPASSVGVAWIYGKEEDGSIYGMEPTTAAHKKIAEDFSATERAVAGFYVDFERYNCPRFTEKDADGNVILDFGIYIN